jgi:1-acyl-sn-glycerol-3-phosphate acyltransferase
MPAQFNSMGAKLAEKAGVPLIPVAIKTDFWDNGRLVRDIGPIRRERPVHVEFGAPLGPGAPARDTHPKVLDFISQRILAWGGEVASPDDDGAEKNGEG